MVSCDQLAGTGSHVKFAGAGAVTHRAGSNAVIDVVELRENRGCMLLVVVGSQSALEPYMCPSRSRGMVRLTIAPMSRRFKKLARLRHYLMQRLPKCGTSADSRREYQESGTWFDSGCANLGTRVEI